MDPEMILGWVFELVELAILGGAVWWARGIAAHVERLHRARRAAATKARRLEAGIVELADELDDARRRTERRELEERIRARLEARLDELEDDAG